MSFPSDWPQTFGVDVASAFPPGLGARFRWFERITPQPVFGAIVEQMLATDPAFRAVEIGEVVRAVTLEGEYAAMVAIAGQKDGAPALRVVGAVFLEHFAAALDSIALDASRFPEIPVLAFELLRSARFLVEARPRPYFYVPPPGWQGVPSRHTANWYPPGFPRQRAVLSISHAERVEGEVDTSDLEAGLAVQDVGRSPLRLANGLAGTYVRVRGTRGEHAAPVQRELALFVIDGRAYRFRLETGRGVDLAAAQLAFRTTVQSFVPLPTPEQVRGGFAFATPTAGASFEHWAT